MRRMLNLNQCLVDCEFAVKLETGGTNDRILGYPTINPVLTLLNERLPPPAAAAAVRSSVDSSCEVSGDMVERVKKLIRDTEAAAAAEGDTPSKEDGTSSEEEEGENVVIIDGEKFYDCHEN